MEDLKNDRDRTTMDEITSGAVIVAALMLTWTFSAGKYILLEGWLDLWNRFSGVNRVGSKK